MFHIRDEVIELYPNVMHKLNQDSVCRLLRYSATGRLYKLGC